MKVRSEVVQIRALEREIDARPRRRTGQYVEEPSVDFWFQSAEVCDRSRTFMNSPG